MAENTQRDEHQLLIGGKWVDASDGTYDIINPATEEVVGRAPNASAADALAAAAAAKEAQPAWAALSVEERGDLMRAAAAAIRAKSAELLPLVIAETGATATVGSRMQVPVAADRFERYARDPRPVLQTPLLPQAAQATPLAPGGHHRRHDQPPAGRRGGLHHVVQLPHGQHGRQGGARPGRRQHRGGQAGAPGPAGHCGAGADPRRGRLPSGRGQPGQRQRPDGVGRAGGLRRRRLPQLHRLHPGRRHHRREGGADHEAPPARARRQGRLRGLRRRRRQGRHRLHRVHLDLPLGPDLHGPDPGRGAPEPLRPGARRAGADGRVPQGRGPDRHRHHHRPGHLGGAARPD